MRSRQQSSPPPRRPSPAEDPAILRAIREYFTGGNTLVRVGIVILFIGVAFLLRYVAEHTHVPIEFRLSGVALGGRRAARTGLAAAQEAPGLRAGAAGRRHRHPVPDGIRVAAPVPRDAAGPGVPRARPAVRIALRSARRAAELHGVRDSRHRLRIPRAGARFERAGQSRRAVQLLPRAEPRNSRSSRGSRRGGRSTSRASCSRSSSARRGACCAIEPELLGDARSRS